MERLRTHLYEGLGAVGVLCWSEGRRELCWLVLTEATGQTAGKSPDLRGKDNIEEVKTVNCTRFVKKSDRSQH